MTAHLDTQRNYGDRAGGVSDPRLVRQVDTLHPLPNTAEEIAAVSALIPLHSPDHRTRDMLAAMILPDTAKEAA